ncbi:hypothetical protein EGW08_015944 [Elysia chlorotica]|uniref:Chromo domain-containing protein n=1 Tax=Elysia chlorotica TaxID=188477 RepID=A0A433T416_ELYCH|nr:hypothetical protein EGW08_015944 [Elysia chlorotica]
MASFSDDEKFDVESILEQRKRKGNLEYLVRWKGAGDGSDSWEPAKTIAADCAQLVQAFLNKAKTPKARRSTSRSRKVSRSRSRSSSRSRRSRSANKTPSKSPSQTRSSSRGRSKKEENKTEASEDTSKKAAELKDTVVSNSTASVSAVSKTLEESNTSEKITETQAATLTHQRVLRSSTMDARKELEVQRVHNDQRPIREDDSKPRSAIWKVADYAVIVLFVVSLVAAFILFLEKIFDLEDFKKQAYPNLGVLKARLLSAQQRLVDLAQSGADLASDAWLYLVEQIKGSATAAKDSGVPKQAPPPAA